MILNIEIANRYLTIVQFKGYLRLIGICLSFIFFDFYLLGVDYCFHCLLKLGDDLSLLQIIRMIVFFNFSSLCA
jgi:hypothetical protein